jgi:hypothetical protein
MEPGEEVGDDLPPGCSRSLRAHRLVKQGEEEARDAAWRPSGHLQLGRKDAPMPTINVDLAREVARISRRREPWPQVAQRVSSDASSPGWAEQAVLVVGGRDVGASDLLVRALATLGAQDQDAMIILVAGVSRLLQRRLRSGQSAEFRADAIAELVLVVADATARGELERLNRLAMRVAWRVHTRLHKRARRTRHRGTANPVTTEVVAPETMPTDRYRRAEPDAADLAVARVDLGRFAEAVRVDVANGVLADRAWTAYRDRRLARAIARRRPATSTERRAAAQAAKAIHRHATTHLALHA